jgi:hypothetical protein
MIRIEFTEEDKKVLHQERFHHPHPRVQKKMEALWLGLRAREFEKLASSKETLLADFSCLLIAKSSLCR